MGRLKEAEVALGKGIQINPNGADLHYLIGLIAEGPSFARFLIPLIVPGPS